MADRNHDGIPDEAYTRLAQDLILRDLLALDRTSLATTRTLLAYVRTFIGLLASGVGLIKVFDLNVTTVLGICFIVAGGVVLVVGLVQYARQRVRLRAVYRAAHRQAQALAAQGQASKLAAEAGKPNGGPPLP